MVRAGRRFATDISLFTQDKGKTHEENGKLQADGAAMLSLPAEEVSCLPSRRRQRRREGSKSELIGLCFVSPGNPPNTTLLTAGTIGYNRRSTKSLQKMGFLPEWENMPRTIKLILHYYDRRARFVTFRSSALGFPCMYVDYAY